jgi:F-type H+-transporting ATPase subunit alpha
MQLNPSEISELIKSKIQNLQGASEVRTQGTVVSVTDGICRVHGLQDVMQGEMLEFPGNTFGMALNLERDSVGAVVLGAYEHISEGDVVKTTGRILEVPVGHELLGRVVNSLASRSTAKVRLMQNRPTSWKKLRQALFGVSLFLSRCKPV